MAQNAIAETAIGFLKELTAGFAQVAGEPE